MRVVSGRTDHVVVIGAGLAGLSAALHLVGSGRQVTVLEREPWPGGRAGRLDVGGYRIDTGPTVLTMPDIIEEAFASVGETLARRLEILPLDPAYHAQFADGSCIDVHSDADRMADSIEGFAGHQQALGYRRLRDWLTRLYRIEIDGFIGANFDSPLDLLTPEFARLAAIGGFRNWDAMVKRFITDSRLRRIFTFQSLYAGVAPQKALAAYAVIAYMDTVSGVFFTRGGVRALPDALYAAGRDAGVQYRFGASATRLELDAGRITAVYTDRDERLRCDAVVVTSELAQAYALLGRKPRRLNRLRPSPSAVVVHVGCPKVEAATAHHTILFGDAWKETFTDIVRHGRLMADPSLLVTRPTHSDPRLAPAGHDLLYLLAPAPNLSRSTVDWSAIGPNYAETILDNVRDRFLPELRDNAQVLDVVTPADWQRRGMVAGTPFALAHTFSQTGPFRPANTVRGIDNAVLAGSSTVPGVGVPTALISGRLAAQRITGIRRRTAKKLDMKAATS